MAPNANATPASFEARATYDDLPHDNLGPQFNVAIWVLTGAAAVFLALRVYCKLIRGKKLWWDDYVLIASFIFLVAQTTLLSVLVHMGFGKHSWDITDWPTYLFWCNVTGVCSIIAAAWSKTAFAILLLHFSEGWMRRLIWFIIASVNIFLGLSAVFTYAQCKPVSRLWDSTVPGECWSPNVIVTYNSFSSAWSGAMDILLAALPWRIINRRSLNGKERLGVLVAMSMGVFAGMTSIAKTATLSAISNPDTISSVSLMILATAETAITIIAASIPVLRVLIKNTMRDHSHSTPHLYRYFNDQNTQPSQNHYRPPSPALTRSPKASPFSAEFSTPPSSPGASQTKTWPGATLGTSSNYKSESGLGLPSREVEEVHRNTYSQ